MKIENTELYGLYRSCHRSGLPKHTEIDFKEFSENQEKRSSVLGSAKTGSGHDNYLKGIIVQFDLYYPEYFSPQLQRYSWIDIVSSMSKMHMITEMNIKENCNEYVDDEIIEIIKEYVFMWNCCRKEGNFEKQKYYFNKIISNLPMGFCKWMSISTNYLQLKTIYNQRKNHKLDEWKIFCEWIEDLPLFGELVLGKNKEGK